MPHARTGIMEVYAIIAYNTKTNCLRFPVQTITKVTECRSRVVAAFRNTIPNFKTSDGLVLTRV